MKNSELENKSLFDNECSDVVDNCRRYQLDRRVQNLSFINRIFHRGGRTRHRRDSDHHHFKYFDRHEPHLVLISVVVILFSLLDAFLTLKIIASGGSELNYFADILIGFGLYGFIFSKYLITAFGMVVLVLHKHYQVFLGLQVRHLIYGIVFFYSALILYEIGIIYFH